MSEALKYPTQKMPLMHIELQYMMSFRIALNSRVTVDHFYI